MSTDSESEQKYIEATIVPKKEESENNEVDAEAEAFVESLNCEEEKPNSWKDRIKECIQSISE